jgi:hypothetical protein
MEPVLVRADIDAALAGIFDLNPKLATIGEEGEEEAEGDA